VASELSTNKNGPGSHSDGKTTRYFRVGDTAVCRTVAPNGGAEAKLGKDYVFGTGFIMAKTRPLVVVMESSAGKSGETHEDRREVLAGCMLLDSALPRNVISIHLLGAQPITLPSEPLRWVNKQQWAHDEAQRIVNEQVAAEEKEKNIAKNDRAARQSSNK